MHNWTFLSESADVYDCPVAVNVPICERIRKTADPFRFVLDSPSIVANGIREHCRFRVFRDLIAEHIGDIGRFG